MRRLFAATRGATARFSPDVVLMDINIPDMDGLQTIGADGHLVKPVDRADLGAVLERA